MTSNSLQISIELGLVLLLGATLLRAWRLERALGQLRRDRGALDALVAGFRAATESAEQSVARLRQAATETGRDLARRIEHAGSLREDLRFLTQRAEAVADRLEHVVRDARGTAAPAMALATAAPAPRAETSRPLAHAQPEDSDRPRSAAERDLLRALKLVR
jgi:hypothetical protein